MIDWIDAFIPSRCAACDTPCRHSSICQSCSTTIEIHESSFLYKGAVKILIRRAKFSRDETAARQLIKYWDDHIELNFHDIHEVTFAPLHWRRRLWRRFDLSSLFARVVAKKINRPLVDILRNTRHDKALTLQQSKTAREKATYNRYRSNIKTNLSKNILLVDDVTTSGATLAAASKPLIDLGHHVETLTLARTPKEGLHL